MKNKSYPNYVQHMQYYPNYVFARSHMHNTLEQSKMSTIEQTEHIPGSVELGRVSSGRKTPCSNV